MKRNIGTTDTVIRYIAAIVIFALGLYFKSWWGLLGLIPLAVAIFGWCPPYAMLGINTCRAGGKSEQPVVEPQAAEPPAAEPQAAEPQVAEPPEAEPPASEPETSESSEI